MPITKPWRAIWSSWSRRSASIFTLTLHSRWRTSPNSKRRLAPSQARRRCAGRSPGEVPSASGLIEWLIGALGQIRHWRSISTFGR